jgi:diadenosine tetraphosphate (Ap4A) HIT family hydrolase
MRSESKFDCPFCSAAIESRIIERLGTVVAIEDKHPVTKGHVLMLPIRHTPDFFSMTFEKKRTPMN